ncbi:MAG: spore protease YyaC [Clostridiales bacterium]|nr:spore protease YyaC [Clostridiales bacterium]
MKSHYYNAFEHGADLKLNREMNLILQECNAAKNHIVVLCIGTDRATGDCLGPLVGDYLKSMVPHIPVFGTLSHPVHALNLEETISNIYHSYQNPFIIAVDASLGIPEHIGYATLSTSPLIPGKGVNKKLPAIGNLSITGIVNVAGFPNSVLLQSTRLHTVVTLANCIGNALYWCFTNKNFLPSERALPSGPFICSNGF